MGRADKERAREYTREWRSTRKAAGLKSPSEEAEKRRVYYAKNRERIRAQQKQYGERNKEKRSARDREYRARQKDAIRARNRLGHYGLTTEAFDALILAQDAKCAVCLKPLDPTGYRTIHVDHDHENGKVRGVLCSNCNLGIGHLKEDAEIMLRAIAYLELHSKNALV